MYLRNPLCKRVEAWKAIKLPFEGDILLDLEDGSYTLLGM